MTTAEVNYLNMGFMLVSCLIAFVLPFELFLFSYAFLGPLHYLTEISWLHKRHYFTTGKSDYILLVIICVIIIFSFYFKILLSWVLTADDKGHIMVSPALKTFVDFLDSMVPAFIASACGAALVMILVKNNTYKLVSYALIIALALLLTENNTYLMAFALFLPTLIHVFIFTFIFILAGALKSRSFSGIISLFVLMGCAGSFFFFVPETTNYLVSEKLRSNYNMSFITLNYHLFKIFLTDQVSSVQTSEQILTLIYESKMGLLLTRFIAFAYTYHYLNWFSKTSVIKWHQVPKKQLTGVVILWLISVTIFLYDYKIGYIVLYLLSMLHVILELPLNFHSFKQIGEEIKLFLNPKFHKLPLGPR